MIEKPATERIILDLKNYANPANALHYQTMLDMMTRQGVLTTVNEGFAMLNVAEWIDASKSKANIVSDYRLAKMIDKKHSAVSSWRNGRNAPDEISVQRICKLTGEDPAPIIAQLEAQRCQDDEARTIWLEIAQRLRNAPRTAQAGAVNLSMQIFMLLIATSALFISHAPTLMLATDKLSVIHIVLFRGLRKFRQFVKKSLAYEKATHLRPA